MFGGGVERDSAGWWLCNGLLPWCCFCWFVICDIRRYYFPPGCWLYKFMVYAQLFNIPLNKLNMFDSCKPNQRRPYVLFNPCHQKKTKTKGTQPVSIHSFLSTKGIQRLKKTCLYLASEHWRSLRETLRPKKHPRPLWEVGKAVPLPRGDFLSGFGFKFWLVFSWWVGNRWKGPYYLPHRPVAVKQSCFGCFFCFSMPFSQEWFLVVVRCWS